MPSDAMIRAAADEIWECIQGLVPHAIQEAFSPYPPSINQAAKCALTAALAQGAGVAARELEWKEAQRKTLGYGLWTTYWRAATVFDWGYRIESTGRAYRFDGRDFDTLEAAKAAAQADYEQRIRAALVASPPEELERERDEARAEIERLRECLRDRPNTLLIAHEYGDHERLSRAAARAIERAETAESQLAEARAQLAALSREGGK